MAQRIGAGMIDMYCTMVKEAFEPLVSEMKEREELLSKAVETEVKKKFGIYDLYVRKAELELELEEIKSSLRHWENRTKGPYGYESPVEAAVRRRTEAMRDGVLKEIQTTLKQTLYEVKLTGVGADIKAVFDSLPSVVASLHEKLAQLPPPDEQVRQIEGEVDDDPIALGDQDE